MTAITGDAGAGPAQRDALLTELASHVLAVAPPHPVRVAIDGCSAAGKTTLADQLAEVLRELAARVVVRVGIDHFKRAVELRTAYPPDTPNSYYLDSWDHTAIRDEVLIPLGPGGSRRYRTAVMDLPARAAADAPVEVASDEAILLADGVFLQRPELDALWDLRIWLDVSFDDVLRRGSRATRLGWVPRPGPRRGTARSTSPANGATSMRCGQPSGPRSSSTTATRQPRV